MVDNSHSAAAVLMCELGILRNRWHFKKTLVICEAYLENLLCGMAHYPCP